MEKNLEKSPKILFALFCASSLFFSSCAKKVGVVDDGSSNTLRYQIEQMLDDFQWSEELEPGRLSEDVSRYGNISDKVLRLAGREPDRIDAEPDRAKRFLI